MNNLPVSITGANPGDLLKAFKGKFKGMIIRIIRVETADRQIHPLATRLQQVEAAQLLPQLVAKLSLLPRLQGRSSSEIVSWIRGNACGSQTTAAEKDRNMVNLQINVLEPGPSTDYARLPQELRDRASQPSGVLSSELLQKMQENNNLKKSPLVFFSDYWTIHNLTAPVERIPPGKLLIDLLAGHARVSDEREIVPDATSAFQLQVSNDKSIWILVSDSTSPRSDLETCALQAAFASLEKKDAFKSLEDFTAAYTEFKTQLFPHLKLAGLKSLLQKLIRFSPRYVHTATGRKPIRAARLLAFTMVALYSESGSLNPDTQTFVRGSEALLKRLLVSGFEDSFISRNHVSTAVSLAAASLLIKHYGTEWQVPQFLLNRFFKLGIHLMQIRDFTSFDSSSSHESADQPWGLDDFEYITGEIPAAKLALVSSLLDEIGSLPGDHLMLRNIAWKLYNSESCHGKTVASSPLKLMPIWHCLDQHCRPDLIFALDPKLVNSFKHPRKATYGALFEAIFSKVTGVNFRKVDLGKEKPQESEFWKTIEKAQELTWASTAAVPVEPLLISPALEQLINPDLPFSYESSWIAGMLGHINLTSPIDKRRFIATLNPDNINEICVIVDPVAHPIGRTHLAILTKELSNDASNTELLEDESRVAITTQSVNKRLQIEPELYELLCKQAWDLLEQKPQPTKALQAFAHLRIQANLEGQFNITPEVDALSPKIKQGILFDCPDIQPSELIRHHVHRQYSFDNVGSATDADSRFANLLDQIDTAILLHSLTYLGTFAEINAKISMPKIGRDGAGSETPLNALDFATFHFLAHLALLYPNALRRRPTLLSSFTVVSPPLLWLLSERIRAKVLPLIERWPCIEQQELAFPYPDMYPHQRNALNRMLERTEKGRKGNFLWIPTGQGKTAIVLQYLKQRIAANALPTYVIYVLPRSAFATVAAEIHRFGLAACVLWPLSQPPTLDRHSYQFGKTETLTSTRQLRAHTIHLIEQDHVRLMAAYLVPLMPRCFVIYDEVHRAMAPQTLRTHHASQLVKLSADFALLSATPVTTGDLSLLTKYVEQMVPFPVNAQNVFVAANTMIRQVLPSPVPTSVHLESVELGSEQLQRYNQLVPAGLGGSNRVPSADSFREASLLAYAAVLRGMVSRIKQQLHYGGVFVVTKDSKQKQELKQLLEQNGSFKKNPIYVIGGGMKTGVNITAWPSAPYPIVLTDVAFNAGYNLQGLSSIITSAYPTNPANLIQLDGRLDRIGQQGIPDPVTGHRFIQKYVILCGLLHNLYHLKTKALNLDEALKSLSRQFEQDN